MIVVSAEQSMLQALRERYGLSAARAARMCEVNVRTWRRWEKGERPVPDAVVKLLRLMCEGR